MYQAGVKKISLYENDGITFNYYDPLDLRAITHLEALSTIDIENINQPAFEIKSSFSKNGKVVFDYTINFLLLGLTTDNIDTIQQLKKSIFGWCFLVEFYDGTYKFYNTPLICRETEIKPHEEMSFEIKLESAVKTPVYHLIYDPDVSLIPIYRADTTLLTADTTIYTADYAL